MKVGIIGCGKIAEVRHAPEFHENPHCLLAGYYNHTPEKAEALARQYGGQVYDSVEALLDSGIDAVSVCTSNSSHASIAIQAMEAGKHVLCEKPMTVSRREAELLFAEAKERNLFLMEGMWTRFLPNSLRALDWIREWSIEIGRAQV